MCHHHDDDDDISSSSSSSSSSSAFLDLWTSHPEYWFKQSDSIDYLVTRNYARLLDAGDTSCAVSDVVLYDQIPRHVYRREAASHIISYFLEKSLARLALLSDTDVSGLSDTVWVFAMLPYRHKGLRTGRVIDDAWARLGTGSRDIVRRFLVACYARVPDEFNIRHRQAFCFHPVSSVPAADVRDLFEYHAYTETCRQELQPRDTSLLDAFKRVVPTNATVIVSLSGGVDSMVCMHNLCQMRKPHSDADGITLVAVHVNYRNRGADDVNAREEAFVEQWCDHHGVDLCVLNLGEINRRRCAENEMRDMYERYTRDRRMAAYVQAGRRHGVAEDAVVNVVLGHNRDDAFENILTNVSHRSKYDNLHGMTDVSTVAYRARAYDSPSAASGGVIRLLRPLLDVSKKAIIAYARLHRIPYFKNTTPAWCQRGQIRAAVVPALVRWDPNVVEGLHGVACELRDMHAAVAALVGGVDWMRIPHTDSPHFWSTLFGSRVGVGRVSRRSLQNFIGKVKRGFLGEHRRERGAPFRVVLNRGTLLEVCVVDDARVSVRII